MDLSVALRPGIRKGHPLHQDSKNAERGKLADFDLFDLVAMVWLQKNRRRRVRASTPEVEDDLELERNIEYWRAVRVLSQRLVNAVRFNDVATLRGAADVIEQLREIPNSGEDFRPQNRLDWLLLKFYATHHSPPSIDQLMRWVGPRMKWALSDTQGRLAADKQLRRRCDKLGLTIKESKPGPKPKR